VAVKSSPVPAAEPGAKGALRANCAEDSFTILAARCFVIS